MVQKYIKSKHFEDDVVVCMYYAGSEDMIMIKIMQQHIKAGIGIMVNLPVGCFDLYALPFRPFLIPGQLISQSLAKTFLTNHNIVSFLQECFTYLSLTSHTKPTNYVCGFFSQSQPKEIIFATQKALQNAVQIRESLTKAILNYHIKTFHEQPTNGKGLH